MPESVHSEPASGASPDEETAPPSFADRQRRLQTGLLTALLGIAVAACLNWASAVFMPIALAILLSIVLSPLVRGLRRIGIAEPIAAALILLLFLGGTGYGVYRLGSPAAEWLRDLPASRRGSAPTLRAAQAVPGHAAGRPDRRQYRRRIAD
jgi:predicted PurR-regulated permease PerM